MVGIFTYREPFYWQRLTHWGRVTHICVGELTIIGSDNGLSPERRQAIIWTNAGILLIEPLGTNFSEILIGIQIFSFKKMRLKMSSAKWRPFCLGLNVLTRIMACISHHINGFIWDAITYPWFPSFSDGGLTHWGRDKMAAIPRRHFEMDFFEWKCLNIDWNVTEVYS